jgi:biotin carboxylase
MNISTCEMHDRVGYQKQSVRKACVSNTEIIRRMKDNLFSELFSVTLPTGPPTLLKIGCLWRLGRCEAYFGTLELNVRFLPAHHEGVFQEATNTALAPVVDEINGKVPELTTTCGVETAVTVILVPDHHKGYVCRSDFLNLRTEQSQFVEQVVPFATWDQYLSAPPISAASISSLLELLPSSPGALVLKQPHSGMLHEDLMARISFPWLLPTKPASRRVAVVSGRPYPDRKRQMYNAKGYFDAARALGISIVVVDSPGHWLEDNVHQNLRDEFIPVDLDITRLVDLPQRLAAALRSKHLDGIVTFWDAYVLQTAQAAELLGLPTEPYTALRQAHFKHEMRQLVKHPDIQAVMIDSVSQLDDPAKAPTISSLRYPLVVKPCRGCTSESVKKVMCEQSMREAVRMTFRDGFIDPTASQVLLETYVDGPEFDANFMLWDGEIQFLEVTDNFPCAADATNATICDAFRETVQISNTCLPPKEIEVIRSSLRQSILKLGLRSGVFHVEARMRNSLLRYQDTYGDGILDLALDVSGAPGPNHTPSVFLVEVNARPPGTGGTWATLFAYGVDQGALHFLRAVNDRERFVVLSQPYSFPEGSSGDGGGAQFWSAQCLIPIHCDNILVPDDLWERVYKALPEVEPYVNRAEMYAHVGTVVSTQRSIGWIGYVLLYSRISRRHLLDMYHQLVVACVDILDGQVSEK